MKVLSAVILLVSVAMAVVRSAPLFSTPYHPIVIWHGLGDSAYAEGMKSLADELREAFPGIYVHLIALAGDLSSDQKAGFFGNVNGQVDQVCDSLTEIPELTNGFDAISSLVLLSMLYSVLKASATYHLACSTCYQGYDDVVYQHISRFNKPEACEGEN